MRNSTLVVRPHPPAVYDYWPSVRGVGHVDCLEEVEERGSQVGDTVVWPAGELELHDESTLVLSRDQLWGCGQWRQHGDRRIANTKKPYQRLNMYMYMYLNILHVQPKERPPHTLTGDPHTLTGDPHTLTGDPHTLTGDPHTLTGDTRRFLMT